MSASKNTSHSALPPATPRLRAKPGVARSAARSRAAPCACAIGPEPARSWRAADATSATPGVLSTTTTVSPAWRRSRRRRARRSSSCSRLPRNGITTSTAGLATTASVTAASRRTGCAYCARDEHGVRGRRHPRAQGHAAPVPRRARRPDAPARPHSRGRQRQLRRHTLDARARVRASGPPGAGPERGRGRRLSRGNEAGSRGRGRPFPGRTPWPSCCSHPRASIRPWHRSCWPAQSCGATGACIP